MRNAKTPGRVFSVAIIGPDGAGKTTICRRALETLSLPTRYVYMGINPDASNHMLVTTRLLHALKRALGAPPDTAGPPDRNRDERPPRNPLRRLFRAVKRVFTMTNRIADEWYRQSVVWFYEWRGNIILFDRHFLFDFISYDAPLQGSWRPLSRRIHGYMLVHLYPRPDVVVCLDAPGEVLFARKGEGTPERLEERRHEYRKMATLVEHFVLVDATLPEDTVLAQVCDAIEEFAAREPDPGRLARTES